MNTSAVPTATRQPPRILVIMIDGLGDRAWPELDHQTPLEAAHTPHLDTLAQTGATGILHPLGPGTAPGTELAHFVLLGYPPADYPGRVVFEAAGCGLSLSPDEVAFRTLFSMVRREADGSLTLVEHFAPVKDELCRNLTARLGLFRHEGLTLQLVDTGSLQGILTISGGGSEDVTDCDPFFTGRPLAAVQPLDNARDRDAARLTAAAVTAFLHHAYAVFNNRGLCRDGLSLFPLLKWVGRKRRLPTLTEHTGLKGTIVGSGILLKGIAAELGLGFHAGSTLPDAGADMEARLEAASAAFTEGADFVLVHTKAADEAGHAKDPSLKRDVIADIDRGLAALTAGDPLRADDPTPPGTLVCVTADHGTPSGTGLIHSGDPLPIVLRGPGVRADHVRRFAARDCASGSLGHLRGELDNQAGRLDHQSLRRQSGA